MVKENKKSFSVKMMCRMLSISLSGYYEWLNRPLSLRTRENEGFSYKIKAIFDEEKSRAGAKCISK